MSTLDVTHKTYGRVLPQPGPLEVRTADKPGQARNVSGQTVSTFCGDGEAVAKRGSKGRKARANTPPAPSAKTLFNGAHHEVQHVRGEMPSGGQNGVWTAAGNWLEMVHCHPARRWLWLFDNKSTALMRGPLFLPALKELKSLAEDF